jgi:branched-chain amino acid transport system substrate-binding protein
VPVTNNREEAMKILEIVTMSAVALALAVPVANAEIKIGAVLSLTGVGASLGIPEKNTIDLMPTEIGGEKVTYIVLDDASDPTIAVRDAHKLIDEDKVDAILGPTVTPTSLALLEVIGPAGTPMISLAGSQSIIVPSDANRRWSFKLAPPEPIQGGKMFDHLATKNGKTIAIFSVNSAFGDSFGDEMAKVAEKRGIKILGREKYNQTDTSATPQALKIIAMNPDAVFIAASGTPAATPVIELRQRGYKGMIYLNQGIANADFLRVGGKSLEGAVFSVSPPLVADQLPDSNPIKKVSAGYIAAYEKKFGPNTRSLFGGTMWDGYLLIAAATPAALKTAKPGTPEFRKALRDNIEKVKDLVGAEGVFNMSEQDHCGVDERAQVLVEIKNGGWVYLN